MRQIVSTLTNNMIHIYNHSMFEHDDGVVYSASHTADNCVVIGGITHGMFIVVVKIYSKRILVAEYAANGETLYDALKNVLNNPKIKIINQ